MHIWGRNPTAREKHSVAMCNCREQKKFFLQQMSWTWTSASLKPNWPGESLAHSLSSKSLHLDVEELSEVTEPFNHLGGHTAVKLDSGEKT